MFEWIWNFFFIYFMIGSSTSDILQGVTVPKYAFAGGSANIGCKFNLNQIRLYSLKWYHNKTEFYRYVPTERKTPINIRPTQKFVLHEVTRTDSQVVLSLSRLTPFASGVYRCEVIAEHPSFRTDASSAKMIVLREPLYPPVIAGWKDFYEPEEMIELICQPMMPGSSSPQPSIKWFIDGEMVTKTRIQQKRRGKLKDVLKIPATKIASLGGKSRVECRLVLGSHHQKSFKTITVRTKSRNSYVNPLSSNGCGVHIKNSTSMGIFVLLKFIIHIYF